MFPRKYVSLLALFLASSPLIFADAINADGSWYEFSFIDTTDQARGCFPADMDPNALNCLPSSAGNSVFAPAPSWTFTVLKAFATITVTDAFLHGDSFDVFDGGVPVPFFSTPMVANDGNGCGDNPVDCLADPNSSHASAVLGPGLHSITITPNAIGDAGAAYFRIVQAPEPATWMGALSALILLAFRRKQ